MSNSREREWRNGYRAGVQDALEVIKKYDDPKLDTPALLVAANIYQGIRRLFLVNPRGPTKGAAKRYNLPDQE